MQKNKKDEATRIIEILLLNRILKADNDPARKTLKSIAKKCGCSVSKVGRAEVFIMQMLSKKVAVLEILINIRTIKE